jgi:hypothetical protein
MYKMRKLKRILSIVIILSVIYLNISVDFTALFNNILQNRHFIQLGASEAYGATEYCIYDKYNAGLTYNEVTTIYTETAPYKLTYYKEGGDVLFCAYMNYYQEGNCYHGVDFILDSWKVGDSLRCGYTYIMDPSFGPSYPQYASYHGLFKPTKFIRRDWDYVGNSFAFYAGEERRLVAGSEGPIALVQAGIVAPSGTYPNDGKYTDGYWYKKVNTIPTLFIISPSPNSTFCEKDTAFIPQISVNDADNETLTCKNYIDAATTPADTKTVTNTSASQTVNFNALDMSTLTDGNHTIKYEISDGKAAPVTSTVNFKVDKEKPVIGTVALTSDTNKITVSGSAMDSICAAEDIKYMYDNGITATAWTSLKSNDFINLNPNIRYNVTFSAIDLKEHIATTQQSIYTKAQVPILSVGNASSYMLDVSTSTADLNPATTQYQIVVNGTQYVTPEGTLTSSPVWTTLDNKKKTVKGLSPSTTYTFTMKARNAVSIESATSAAVNGTTLVAPPGSPANITAQATYNSITLTWDPVPGATKYEVLVNDVTTVNNNLLTSYTHSGLGANTQHTYKVRANIGTVIGAWSALITKNTLTSAPPTPLNVKAAANNTSIIVTWDPAPGATTYQIKVDNENSNTFSGTNYVHNGLVPGTQHSYQVRSLNSGGESAWSEEIKVTALTDKPVIPANLTATPGKTQIVLSWNGIIGETYEVEADGVIYNTSSTPSFTHKDLTPGTEHTYRVRSNRSGILSNWCAVLSASTSANIFGVPGNFIADASDNMVELSWDSVAEATGYELEVDGSIIDNGMALNCIHLGLTPGSQHTYKVRAKKDTQTSDWSKAAVVTTFILPTPENFSAATSQTAITLNWDAVADASGYELEMDGAVTENITSTSHAFPGLISGSQHVFRIRAVNQNGLSAWSTKLTKSTQLSSFKKTELSAISRKNSVIVMWDEIEGASSYDVSVDNVTMSGITGLRYIHNNLTPGSIHLYKVKAVRGQEVHDWSDELSVKTISLSPDAPTNIEASSTTNKILISWDRVDNAAEYVIEVDGQAVSVGSGTSYMHSGLLPDSQHTYRIMSKSALNESSAWSTPVTLKTKNSTRSYTVDCEQDDTFNFIFTASNLQDPSQYTFTITYDAAQLEIEDLCASTSRLDTGAGSVTGSDVNIIMNSPGTIVFKKIKPEIIGQMWSGTVNSIKFKSKINGQPIVQYTIN